MLRAFELIQGVCTISCRAYSTWAEAGKHPPCLSHDHPDAQTLAQVSTICSRQLRIGMADEQRGREVAAMQAASDEQLGVQRLRR